MRNKFLLFCLALSMAVMAGERSAVEAAAVAAQFMNQQVLAPARKASVKASSYQLAHTRLKLNSTEPAFYVFNASEGYVVVSADDRTEDVLMYSEQGTLDIEKANPNLKFWLKRLQEEISVANDENTYTAAEKKARKATMVTAISPLLVNKAGTEIAWYQESPYWNQCPMDKWKTSERCLTGCVATAAAMIMYKWRYPEKGTGSRSYTWECCMNSQCTKTSTQTLSKDFSTVTFDWDNMLATYNSGSTGTTDQKNAVATLMYCCGVACDMGYGGSTIGGSGAWTDDMGYGLKTYFGYKVGKFITTYSKSDYQQAKGAIADLECEWSLAPSAFTDYFNTELEAGRPILMGGEDSDGGHEFVCDGRNTSGYFHINWGWEGEGNNYCKLSALKPSGSSYNFSSEIDALIGLEPAVVDTVHVTGVTVAPTKLTLKQKEKSTLTATVAPSNATDKTVTWSSSDSKIASVSATGVVTGVAQGNVTITATTKDGNKKATCAVTVTNEIIETTECDNYSYTFTKKCSTGSNTLGTYTWNIALDAGEVQPIDPQYGKGQQFGSSKNPCGQVSLTTSNTAECIIDKVIVGASIGSKGDGKLAVYIGGKQIGSTQTLTTTNTEYTFTNTADVQGNLEIRLTNSAKAMYIKSIEVNPDSPTSLDQPRAADASTKVLINGQLYLIQGDRMYNIQGQLVK